MSTTRSTSLTSLEVDRRTSVKCVARSQTLGELHRIGDRSDSVIRPAVVLIACHQLEGDQAASSFAIYDMSQITMIRKSCVVSYIAMRNRSERTGTVVDMQCR